MLHLEKKGYDRPVVKLGDFVGEEANGSILHIEWQEVMSTTGKVVDEGKARILKTLADILDTDENDVPTNARLSREGTWVVPKGLGLSNDGFGKTK